MMDIFLAPSSRLSHFLSYNVTVLVQIFVRKKT